MDELKSILYPSLLCGGMLAAVYIFVGAMIHISSKFKNNKEDKS